MPKKPPKKKRGKAWYLYLLECADGSIYTGIAIDVEARYAAHVSGKGARYTRSHPPVRILKTVRYRNRSLAAKAEYATKQWTAEKKRKFVVLTHHRR